MRISNSLQAERQLKKKFDLCFILQQIKFHRRKKKELEYKTI